MISIYILCNMNKDLFDKYEMELKYPDENTNLKNLKINVKQSHRMETMELYLTSSLTHGSAGSVTEEKLLMKRNLSITGRGDYSKGYVSG